ncbi:MAG: hypothetical protein AAF590_10550 [Pseudomonadota bacterium]
MPDTMISGIAKPIAPFTTPANSVIATASAIVAGARVVSSVMSMVGPS